MKINVTNSLSFSPPDFLLSTHNPERDEEKTPRFTARHTMAIRNYDSVKSKLTVVESKIRIIHNCSVMMKFLCTQHHTNVNAQRWAFDFSHRIILNCET